MLFPWKRPHICADAFLTLLFGNSIHLWQIVLKGTFVCNWILIEKVDCKNLERDKALEEAIWKYLEALFQMLWANAIHGCGYLESGENS